MVLILLRELITQRTLLLLSLDEKALHPVAIIAVNAEASLAADGKYAKQCVEKFWNTPLRTGDRRYYDNFLYMFAMLALSGNYRIY